MICSGCIVRVSARPSGRTRLMVTSHSCLASFQATASSGLHPDVQLEQLGVAIEPLGELVLWREDRPVIGELDVWEMVVPDGVVQHKLVVPLPPVVAHLVVGIDDECWHVEHLEAGVGGQPALTGTFEESAEPFAAGTTLERARDRGILPTMSTGGVAVGEISVVFSSVQPILPPGLLTMLDALLPVPPYWLLVTLQFLEHGVECPYLPNPSFSTSRATPRPAPTKVVTLV